MHIVISSNPGNAGESLNDSLLGDKNLTKSTVGEEEQYNKESSRREFLEVA